jgi:multiple sugar transport system substrate-binding protein
VRNTANRNILRWRVRAVVLCAVVSVVVAACGGDSGDEGGGGSTEKVDMAAELKKPATITVWAWTPGTEEAVEMFEKAYPNIKVKLQNVGQGPPHYQKVRTVLKSGQGLPDVIHMEFQFLPSFKLTDSLLDIKPYLPENFLSNYPEWIQKQINLDGGIYGVPWDTGPLALIYRKDLLDKAGIKTPIKTWDEFADAAVKYHEANPDSYLVNMPGGQTGQWLGLFWQNGALPFTGDPQNLKVNLTDPKIKQVTEYWDKLYESGAISHDADFVDAWYQGFARGKYAGWLSAAWGPIFLQDYTKSSKGNWRAQPLPQWEEGQNVSGNWGGSTLAVLKQSKSPAAATEFARWILNERQPVEMFSFERFLFPPQNFMLNNEQWLNRKYPFYGDQEVNKVYADAASAVDVNWQWSPIHEYIATQGDAIKAKSVDQGNGATAALQPWQDAVVNYAKQQGLTVAGE